MAAASYNDFGHAWIAASRMTIVKPTFFQTLTTMRPGAPAGALQNAGVRKARAVKNWLSKPMSGSSKNFQTMANVASEPMTGKKKMSGRVG